MERIEAPAERGLGSEEIGERLGLARSTLNKYRRGPEGEREWARRKRYRGGCRGCGRPTRGSDDRDACPSGVPSARRFGAGAGGTSGCWGRSANGRG
jgi:hypothetical protein